MEQSNKKEHIRNITAQLIADHGFHAVKTAAIANAAQVSDTLIFKYFGSLEKLFQSVCAESVPGISNFSMDADVTSDKDFLAIFTDKFIQLNTEEPLSIVLYIRAMVERKDLLSHIPEKAIESGVMMELRYRFMSYYGDQKGLLYFDLYWKFLLFYIMERHSGTKSDYTIKDIGQQLAELFF